MGPTKYPDSLARLLTFFRMSIQAVFKWSVSYQDEQIQTLLCNVVFEHSTPCQHWHPKLVCSDMNFSWAWLHAAGIGAPEERSCSLARAALGHKQLCIWCLCAHTVVPPPMSENRSVIINFLLCCKNYSTDIFSQNSTHSWVSAAQWSCELCCLSRMCLLISASAQMTDTFAKQKYRCLLNWVVLS